MRGISPLTMDQRPIDCPQLSNIMRSSLSSTGVITTTSISLFGMKLHQDPSQVSNYKPVSTYFAWPFYVRLLGTISVWIATSLTIIRHCRGKATPADQEDRVVVISATQDAAESPDEENGALL